MRNHFSRHWFVLSLAFAACGDDAKLNPDAAPSPDAAPPIDGGPAQYVPPTPIAVPLSAAGPDQLQAATAAPGNKFYAAGYAAATLTGPRLVTVVKYGAAGIDETFGNRGIVTTTLDFKGGSDEVDITTQPDGKILVSATVAALANANDRDIAVIRLLDTGGVDTTFGDNGIARINANDAVDMAGTLLGTDAPRSITVNADAIFLHVVSRGVGNAAAGGPRLDTDFTVVKLKLDGKVDDTFGSQGYYRLDIAESGATPRAIRVLDDGKLLVSGYANSPGINTTQPVLYKVTAAGALDTTFAQGGVFHETVLALQTEVYNFAIHGTRFVTAGYGRQTGATNDYVSLRFDLNTGARDLTWGGTANGAVVFDPSGTMLGSNCRNAIALPNGKTVMMGSTGPGNQPAQDAVFAVLDATGKLDTVNYGTGIHKYALGSNGNDQFWGGAVSGDQVTVVGYKGGGPAASQTDTTNDDSFRVVFTVK
jgi:uncharacterized delta-60 repeat protein